MRIFQTLTALLLVFSVSGAYSNTGTEGERRKPEHENTTGSETGFSPLYFSSSYGTAWTGTTGYNYAGYFTGFLASVQILSSRYETDDKSPLKYNTATLLILPAATSISAGMIRFNTEEPHGYIDNKIKENREIVASPRLTFFSLYIRLMEEYSFHRGLIKNTVFCLDIVRASF